MSELSRIEERGNGFPGKGDYVADANGELYRVVSMGSNIRTDGPGGNYIFAEVEEADWSEIEGKDPFPARVLRGEA